MMEEVGIQSEVSELIGLQSAPAASPFFSLLKSSHSIEDQLSCPLVSLMFSQRIQGVPGDLHLC